ncbi:sugar transferase [Anaerococcus marasmi]|uniref:sugar transferase n=1 Tax=Anaerococcus marasmi TaxID=2057797 RepID=UPI000CF9FEF3|nr:sugar transferase [Anaerococcus marasmi]
MRVYVKFKRLLDIILSLFLMILLLPLFLILSILIKIDSKGPVLYKQSRTGLNGADFILLKFRSMEADNNVYDFKTVDKITKIGKFIRKTSLDELPQLINILKGDMSFIGPRPWLPILNKYYTDSQKKRFLVRPGLTGIAQVSGRKDLNIIDRINLDLKYVDNISLLTDLKILGRTILVIINNADNTRENYTIEDEIEDLKNNFLFVNGKIS